MKIQTLTNTVAQENTYLLSNSTFNLIIDPGSDPTSLLEILQITDRPVSAILLTHAHFDHIMGLGALREAFPDVPIYLHPLEKEWMNDGYLNASLLLMGRAITAPDADIFYEPNGQYHLDGFHFRVLETPGHSVGGVSLVFDEELVVFTGDALFKNSIGRWDLPTGNQQQLLSSIRTQLFTLPEEMVVYPGHGPSTTIGLEKRNNPFL